MISLPSVNLAAVENNMKMKYTKEERKRKENIAKDKKVIPDPIDDRKFQE